MQRKQSGSSPEADLGLGGQRIDVADVTLLVVLGVRHQPVEVVAVNQFQHSQEHVRVASGHFVDVVAIAHDQGLRGSRGNENSRQL